MEKALVLGATGGIGQAITATLRGRGVAVTGLSRADGLDLTDPEAVERVMGAVSGGFDLIFVPRAFWPCRGRRPKNRCAH